MPAPKATCSATASNANAATTIAGNVPNPTTEVPLPQSIEDVAVMATPPTVPTLQNLAPSTVH